MPNPPPAGGVVHPGYRGSTTPSARRRALAERAEAQHGRVSHEQLTEIGFAQHQIDRLLGDHLLVIEHRGVYRFGVIDRQPHGRWRGALLACGEGSALSHRSGARFRHLRSAEERLDVTVPRATPLHRGITLHRPLVLDPRDVECVDGFEVTTVAKTLVDLAAVVRKDALARALRQSVTLEVFDLRALESTLGRHRGRRGVGVLKELLATHYDWNVDTRERLEQRFRKFVIDRRIEPRPEHNVLVFGHLCDAVWREHRLVVELDSRAHHLRDPVAFERDRRRDADLAACGWLVIRITWRRLHDDPAGVETLLRRLLEDRRCG